MKTMRVVRCANVAFFIITMCLMLKDNVAAALDLKIDLPIGVGKAPILYDPIEPPVNSIDGNDSELASDTPKNGSTYKDRQKESQYQSSELELDSEQEAMLHESKIAARYFSEEKSTERLSKLSNSNIFPDLPCLKDNIQFWELIYSKIDLNEAVIHDREKLNRIYGMITVPKNRHKRERVVEYEKRKYAKILLSLAQKIRSNKPFTPQEKKVANLFSKKELTPQYLLNAKDNIRVQTGLKTQFDDGIKRSMNYMPIIYPIIKKSGMPSDLLYLPHVESSFNSRAGSKVGAQGLWQLMPRTMKSLEGSRAVRKRSDPVISTRAAMKLLKRGFDKIKDWPLAITAYNHGENGILRAMEETGTKDLCKIIARYDSPSFKFASSNFYAQFLAARKIARKKYAVIAQKHNNSFIKSTLLNSKSKR